MRISWMSDGGFRSAVGPRVRACIPLPGCNCCSAIRKKAADRLPGDTSRSGRSRPVCAIKEGVHASVMAASLGPLPPCGCSRESVATDCGRKRPRWIHYRSIWTCRETCCPRTNRYPAWNIGDERLQPSTCTASMLPIPGYADCRDINLLPKPSVFLRRGSHFARMRAGDRPRCDACSDGVLSLLECSIERLYRRGRRRASIASSAKAVCRGR